jgi:Amt family ammonium transporter
MNRCLHRGFLFASLWAVAWEGVAFAEDMTPTVNSGDTAWMLVSAALVLLMTPGLAFFYGGMVRTKNVLSTLFQNFAVLSIIGVLWCVVGYSLAFSKDIGGLIGSLDWFMLKGVGQAPNPDYAATIPHLLFMAFQCMFAVISPALITGSVAERLNFKAWVAFAAIWSLCVYAPVAHWVWGVGGWIREFGGLDFAGGLVVHMTAGYSALVAALMLGKRRDFGKTEVRPYDTGFVLLGTALLWFGWFGFNGGSALSASGLAAQAFVTTLLGAAGASLSWAVMDSVLKGKPSAIGGCIGAVVGLVTITPAAGFVSAGSALLIGLISGVVCNYAAIVIKEKLHLDDTLDVFACHGLGGTLGSLLTPIFASRSVNEGGVDGAILGNFKPLWANTLSSIVVVAFSMIMTYLIIKFISLFSSIRVAEHDELRGLDATQHGEVINSETTGELGMADRGKDGKGSQAA